MSRGGGCQSLRGGVRVNDVGRQYQSLRGAAEVSDAGGGASH